MLRKTRKNKSPKRKAFDKAWRLTSNFIRERDNYICFTCGAQLTKQNSDAGHFIHGKTKPCYFNEKNINCQCRKCNHFLGGNRDVYLRNIQKKYGIKVGDELMAQRYQTKYWTIKELNEIIEKYS